MPTRWSVASQLLALQLGIIAIVLIGVAGVSLAQARIDFRRTEGARVLSAAENLAARPLLRQALAEPSRPARVERAVPIADGVQTLSGVSFVEIADVEGVVVANTRDPGRLGAQLYPAGSAPTDRSWVGDSSAPTGQSVVAHVPVLGESGTQIGRVVGLVAVGRDYPTLGEDLLSAVPNMITYLGLAGIVGIAGSLLVARRVKRQTLGLEPVEIRGLVEHREAMLTGIKEGVIGLDLDDRVTLVNAEAHLMLGLPADCIGRTLTELGVEDRLLDVLTGVATQPDAVVFVGERILTLNRKPVAVRGATVGSVTTMRDLTELRQLQQELGVTRQTTEALRAQAHEFANRLHTISGLLELGEYDEVLRYVKRLDSGTQNLAAAVTQRIESPPLAALLIAKSSVAAERGIRLQIAAHSWVGPLADDLAEDLATVVGNLVDNALDAVGPLGGGEVEVTVEQRGGEPDGEVAVQVRDSGPGVAPELVEEVFTSGFTTKAAGGGYRGFGLALTRTICARRGGTVGVRNDNGAVFSARLPLAVPESIR
jgi:sensor histidine kinase regulating citrate/malate metabolism